MKKLLLILLCFGLLSSCENKEDKVITAQMLINGYTGKGVCFLPNVGRYSGEFKDGMRHGQGNFYPAYGDSWVQNEGYRGEWKDDMRHGEGTFSGDGLTYVGEWKYDKWNGKGICTWNRGDYEYSGEWKDFKRHGEGIEKRHSEGTYEGEYKDDKRHGRGIYHALSGGNGGGLYEGEWKDDKRNGQFKFIHDRADDKSGSVITFKDGKQLNYYKEWKDPIHYIAPTNGGRTEVFHGTVEEHRIDNHHK